VQQLLQDGGQNSLSSRLEKTKKAIDSQPGTQNLDTIVSDAVLQEDPSFYQSLVDVTQTVLRDLALLKLSSDQNQAMLDELVSLLKSK
jgi:hypothetical protein